MVKLDCSSTQDFADGSILSTNESIIIESDSDDDDDDTLAGINSIYTPRMMIHKITPSVD